MIQSRFKKPSKFLCTIERRKKKFGLQEEHCSYYDLTNNKREFVFKEVYEDGVLEMRLDTEGERWEGLCYVENYGGYFYAHGYSKNGAAVGHWKTYHDNGQVDYSAFYDENGEEDGVWLQYSHHGHLIERKSYRQGKLHGPSENFTYEDGRYMGTNYYLDGVCYATLNFHDNGQIESFSFADIVGEKSEVYYCYDEKGNFTHVLNYSKIKEETLGVRHQK